MHSSLNLFILFSLLILFPNPENMRLVLLSSSSEIKLFEFHSLPPGYLAFLGDSHVQDRDIALTKEYVPANAPKSAGVVLYNQPILFLDPHSKKKTVPSFYTMFAFCIQSMNGDRKASGDGLAFLISPDDNLLGSPGYLGLVDSTDLNRNKFIAVEFDTKYDSMFGDPDDNHVGLDINSLFSVELATSHSLASLGVDLKSGNLITTWIDYKSDEKRLEVFLSASNLKPKNPLLKVDINLSDYLKENMFVGFSAATEGSMQSIHIDEWEFTVMEFNPPPPPPSPLEEGKTFLNPSESENKQSHLSRFAIALAVGLLFVPIVLLFGWFCWKKLIGMVQQSEGTNNLPMQNIRSSGGVSCQEILLSILVDEVCRGLNMEKVLDNDVAERVKSSPPLCDYLPAVESSIFHLCNSLPLRTNDINSV